VFAYPRENLLTRKKESTESVQEIIGKVVVDGEYRELLFSESDKTMENYELTKEEKSALKGMDRDMFCSWKADRRERLA